MPRAIDLDLLLHACSDDSFEDGIRVETELEPVGGPGSPVKPAVYERGTYQEDKRWRSPSDDQPTDVIVIDNVPSQANRLEDALRRWRGAPRIPELVLDLSDLPGLPAHLPQQISSLKFPHRNADAYLRDSELDGVDFLKTELGNAIFGATAERCGPLIAWFPQSLLYGFWQSHLGKKRSNAKHARAWVSEIVGWSPASTTTKTSGLKGDPLNLNTDEALTSNPENRVSWDLGTVKIEGGKKDKLSEIGHGQVPFMGDKATAAPVSFASITQRAVVSFAQLRRVSLGTGAPRADAAVRAVLVAMGLHAHVLAFGRGFALRSGAELRPVSTAMTWLGGKDEECEVGGVAETAALLDVAVRHAGDVGAPLGGWESDPVGLTPKHPLAKAIRATWPELPE